MSGAPFMQLYVGDYMADTTLLTTEQHGAYLLLLMTMWRHDAKLPDDPRKLSRIARTTIRKWPAIWDGIEGFFDVSDGVITNKRLTKEHQKAVAKSELRANAGSLGGKAKALKNNDTGLAKASGLLKHSSEPEPYSKKEEPKGSKKKPPLFSLFPSTVSEEVAKAYVEHRRAIKKPLTPRAITLLSKTLAECEANGITADTALDTAIESGWQGLKLSWVQNALSQNSPTNGARNERPRTTAYDRAAADQSDIASAWIAEGRRQDAERSVGDGASDPFDTSERGMDCGPNGDAVVTWLPSRAEREGLGGSGPRLDSSPFEVSAVRY